MKGLDKMKLKYYLRGLGIGMFVCAFILSLTIDHQPQMSDQDIRNRAKELGMIENVKLAEQAKNQEEEIKEETKEETIAEEEAATEEEVVIEEEAIVDEVIATEEEPVVEEEFVVEEEPVVVEESIAEESLPKEVDFFQLDVISGDSSYSVSRKLEEAGIILSAKELDAYLCENGYDKKIRVGTHQINRLATFEEIANEIAN